MAVNTDKAIVEAFERQCLLSYSTNKSGEVIKKYNFPTPPPYNESQKEDRMIHQMNQAIGHAFVNHAPIMANYVHNAVLKTLQDRGGHLALWTGLSTGQSDGFFSYWIGYWDITDSSSNSGR